MCCTGHACDLKLATGFCRCTWMWWSCFVEIGKPKFRLALKLDFCYASTCKLQIFAMVWC